MMQNPLVVCYNLGGNYWIPGLVSINSLIRNNPNTKIEIKILHDQRIPSHFKKGLDVIIEPRINIATRKLKIEDTRIFERLPGNKARLSKANLYKLLIPQIYDTDSSILYLDADTLILGNLNPIFKIDHNKILSAAPDFKNLICTHSNNLLQRYFNAGVILFNVKQYNEKKVLQKVLDYLIDHQPHLDDQSGLNYVIHNEDGLQLLSPLYNMSRSWALGERAVYDRFSLDRPQQMPKIVHFYQYGKPWSNNRTMLFDDLWFEYFNELPPHVRKSVFIQKSKIMSRAADVVRLFKNTF